MSEAVLRLADVTVRRDDRVVVDRVSFSVHQGEVVALMGESGSGKTTILRVTAGLEPLHAGEVDLAGIRLRPRGSGVLDRERLRPHALGISRADRRALGDRVGMVFQFHNLFANLTALENVWLAPVHVHRKSRAEAEARATALLDSLGVGHRAAALPHQLSGGEAQRVAIARALAVDPPLLLMDEPTASLDPARRADLAGLLTSLVARGRALLIATHDADFARACATRIVRITEGRVVHDSPAPR